jgi:hypothetical protein
LRPTSARRSAAELHTIALLRTQLTVVGVRRAADGRVVRVTYPQHRRRNRYRRGPVRRRRGRRALPPARVFGADLMAEHRARSGTFYCYVAGLDFRGYEFHIGESARAGVFPTHDGEACVLEADQLAALSPVPPARAEPAA